MAGDGYVGGSYDDVAFGDDPDGIDWDGYENLEERTLKTVWSKIAWDPATGFRSRTAQVQHFRHEEFWISVNGDAMALSRSEFLDLARAIKGVAEKVEEES